MVPEILRQRRRVGRLLWVAMLLIGLTIHGHALRPRLAEFRASEWGEDLITQRCRQYAELQPHLPDQGVVGYRSPILLDSNVVADFGTKRNFLKARHQLGTVSQDDLLVGSYSLAEARQFIRQLHIAQYCLAPVVLDAGPALAIGETEPVDTELLIIDRLTDPSRPFEFDPEQYRIRVRLSAGLMLLEEIH